MFFTYMNQVVAFLYPINHTGLSQDESHIQISSAPLPNTSHQITDLPEVEMIKHEKESNKQRIYNLNESQ